MRIGSEGHVSYLELVPNVAEVRETVVERYSADHEDPKLRWIPRITGTEEVPDPDQPRIPTGETVCEWARVTAVEDSGLLTCAGFSTSGRATTWRGVQEAPSPVPVTEPGREDPAGHAFHLTADCPWGR